MGVDVTLIERYGDKRGDERSPELNMQEKIRKRIDEIEQPRGKKLKSTARRIIEQHAPGNGKQKEKIVEKVKKVEGEINKSGPGLACLSVPKTGFIGNKKKRKTLLYNPQI